MMERTANILDKIGSLIPGYIGYAERQGRRTSDKKLRDTIVSKMNLIEKEIQAKIDTAISNKDTVLMNALETCRKKLNTLKSKIEYAPYGESALFSDKQIKEDELQHIYTLDFELADKTTAFTLSVVDPGPEYIHKKITDIENIFEKRSQYIKQF